MTSPTDNADALESPEPGQLKIKEKRTWRTWQLLTASLVAAIFGMWINGDTGGGSSSASTEGSGKLPPSETPPPSSGAGATTTTAAGGATTTTAAAGATTTTAAAGASTTTTVAGATTTTAAGSTTPSSAAAGPARVLLESPQQKGNWTSASFTTTAAPWNIGWAFACAPAPAAGPSFQVFAVPAGSAASGTPVISETGASGQSVTAASSLGAQTLIVQAPASCTWIVKVTGS